MFEWVTYRSNDGSCLPICSVFTFHIYEILYGFDFGGKTKSRKYFKNLIYCLCNEPQLIILIGYL